MALMKWLTGTKTRSSTSEIIDEISETNTQRNTESRPSDLSEAADKAGNDPSIVSRPSTSTGTKRKQRRKRVMDTVPKQRKRKGNWMTDGCRNFLGATLRTARCSADYAPKQPRLPMRMGVEHLNNKMLGSVRGASVCCQHFAAHCGGRSWVQPHLWKEKVTLQTSETLFYKEMNLRDMWRHLVLKCWHFRFLLCGQLVKHTFFVTFVFRIVNFGARFFSFMNLTPNQLTLMAVHVFNRTCLTLC